MMYYNQVVNYVHCETAAHIQSQYMALFCCKHPVKVKRKILIITSDTTLVYISVDKMITFCILYFSSNSCSTCFGQPCAHHQELTTA